MVSGDFLMLHLSSIPQKQECTEYQHSAGNHAHAHVQDVSMITNVILL